MKWKLLNLISTLEDWVECKQQQTTGYKESALEWLWIKLRVLGLWLYNR